MTPKQEREQNARQAGSVAGFLFAGLYVLPLLVEVAWNLGIVGLVHAAGGSCGRISFWTAFGAWFAAVLVRITVAPQRSEPSPVTIAQITPPTKEKHE